MMEPILKMLDRLIATPGEPGERKYTAWLDQNDFVDFVVNASKHDHVPLYVSYGRCADVWIFPWTIKAAQLKGDYVSDLHKFECGISDTWSWGSNYKNSGKIRVVALTKPFSHCRSTIGEEGNPLVYRRSFDGYPDFKSYIEFDQHFAQIHNIHFIQERNAYCRLDENGDLDEVVKINQGREKHVVSISRRLLDEHLFITNSVLVRHFQTTRLDDIKRSIDCDNITEVHVVQKEKEFHATLSIAHDKSGNPIHSRMHGFHIIRCGQTRRRLRAELTGTMKKHKKYEAFICWDFKNRRVLKYSCDPKKTDTYFQDTGKPFETSPAFFNPEVLSRYKMDPDKYEIRNGSIVCRGTWALEKFDTNASDQVFVYLCYLAHLPFKEQMYWKAFNEMPKAGLPQKTINQDFKGQFDLSYEPLRSFKNALRVFEVKCPEIFKIKGEKLLDQVNYPHTDSKKEWSGEIHTLDKLVVEGLDTAHISEIARQKGFVDPKAQSIQLIGKILQLSGVSSEGVDAILSPFREAHYIRSKVAAHLEGSDAKQKLKEAIGKYGSLKNHYYDLISRMDASIRRLTELLAIDGPKDHRATDLGDRHR